MQGGRFIIAAGRLLAELVRQPYFELGFSQGRFPVSNRLLDNRAFGRDLVARSRLEETGLPHLDRALAEYADDLLDFLIAMRCGQEARESLSDVDTLVAHIKIKEAAKP